MSMSKSAQSGARSGLFFCWSSLCSAVCLSHRKAEAGTLRGQMKRRQEHLSGCNLWEVVVVYCCFLFDYSALVSVGEQVSAAFIIIESQNISTWKGP